MTKSDINTNTNTPPSKTDAIIEKARKLTAGFTGEDTDTGNHDDNVMTRAEVIASTPFERLEFFKAGGRIED